MTSNPELPRAHILCAFSGGRDSVVLLHMLHKQLQAGRITFLTAAHYNHNLRPESDEEELFAKDFCAALNIPFAAGRGDVSAAAEREKRGIEETARDMRYAFLEQTAPKCGAEYIATAHHANDNLETMLLNLTRGAGLDGLCGIPPERGNIIRPLLAFTRSDIDAYIEKHSLSYCEDLSNYSVKYNRNRVRAEVLPVLSAINPKAVENATKTASLLRKDAEYLDILADEAIERLSLTPEHAVLSVKGLKELHPALFSRVIRRFSRKLHLYNIEDTHIIEIDKLCRAKTPHGECSLPSGFKVRRVYGALEFIPSIPEEGMMNDFAVKVEEIASFDPENIHKMFNTFYISNDRINGKIVVRTRRPGDTFTIGGGTKTVKKLFIDKKIPLHLRDNLRLAADDTSVLAVEGIGVNCKYLPEKGKKALKITIGGHNDYEPRP